MPDRDPDELLARCRALCPDFVATSPLRRHRKSEILAGEVGGSPVIAKRVYRASAVWIWYARREIALYRAAAAGTARDRWTAVPMPTSIAASDDVLIVERILGAPLATVRRPWATLAPGVLDNLLAVIAELERIELAPCSDAGAVDRRESIAEEPPPEVRAALRDRLLEDPTSDGAWILEGLALCARRGLLDTDAVLLARAALADAPRVFAHGDLLLRNVIVRRDEIVLVDWECAGVHLRDWDRALLWTQLDEVGRAHLEASLDDAPSARRRAFHALVVFALARELRFARSFPSENAAITRRIQESLAAALSRLA